jgi:hypothetical protein
MEKVGFGKQSPFWGVLTNIKANVSFPQKPSPLEQEPRRRLLLHLHLLHQPRRLLPDLTRL